MINFWKVLELQEEHKTSRLLGELSTLTHWGILWLMVKFSLLPQLTHLSPISSNLTPYLLRVLLVSHLSEQKTFFSDMGVKIVPQKLQGIGKNVFLIPSRFLNRQSLRFSFCFNLSAYGI